MQQALIDSAIHFCELSQVVVYEADPVTVAPGSDIVDIELPSQQTLAQLLSVYAGTRYLTPVARDNVQDQPTELAEPSYYFTQVIDEQLQLRLYPGTKEGCVVRLRMTTKPTRAATSVPTVLFNEYVETIVDGALARLLAMPEQNFTNEPKAMLLEQRVRRVVAEARTDAARGRMRTSIAVKPRPFA